MTDHRPDDDALAEVLRGRLAEAVSDDEPSDRLRTMVMAAASAGTEPDASMVRPPSRRQRMGAAAADLTGRVPILGRRAAAEQPYGARRFRRDGVPVSDSTAVQGDVGPEPYDATGSSSSSDDRSGPRAARGPVSWRWPLRMAAVLLPLVLAVSVFLTYGGDDDAVTAGDDRRSTPGGREEATTSTTSAPASTELSPDFLDILAPVSGDGAARAKERSNLALARAASGPKARCMIDKGFPEYQDIGLMETADLYSGQAYLLYSPTKLERRGFTGVADARLDAIPTEAKVAWGECSGEVEGIKAAAADVDAFIVYRDGRGNPIPNWWQSVVQVETDKIVRSDDPKYEDYRECLRQMGFSGEAARDPNMAAMEGSTERTMASMGTIDPVKEQLWREGKGVLDPDGGAMARSFAACWRLYERHLTPALEQRREEAIEGKQEALLEGQNLLYKAIGGEEALAREKTVW